MSASGVYPTSETTSYHRIERPEDELRADERCIDVAVLDMNHGWHNLGHDAILVHLHNMAHRLRSPLAGADLKLRVFSYDVRRSLVVPEPGRFPLLIGTGGPGHIDPTKNDGVADTAQGVNEDPSWQGPLKTLFDSILRPTDPTALVAICHTYGVLCRLSGLAEPVLRDESKGGKSAGVVPNVLTSEASTHPFYVRLSRFLPENASLRVTDNRLFDLVETSTNGHDVLRLGYESDEAGQPGDALTMVEFARDREGIMPRVLGVNHHPEVVGRNYIRNVLESKWSRGEVTKEWHDERVMTLEKHFSGEYDQQIRVTSIFTFLAPVEFHLQRLVRERREALGFEGALDENMVILGAEAACGMEALTD
jgi:hypothetical protein